MEAIIACREPAMDCDLGEAGLTGSETVTTIIRHVREEHTVDWFEPEEIHERLGSLLGGIGVSSGGRSGDI